MRVEELISVIDDNQMVRVTNGNRKFFGIACRLTEPFKKLTVERVLFHPTKTIVAIMASEPCEEKTNDL